jgi:hypothetical protein
VGLRAVCGRRYALASSCPVGRHGGKPLRLDAPVTESLDIETTADLLTGVITVAPAGDLTVMTAPILRAALFKSTAQCPDAVVVDLSELRVDHPSRLAVFPAAARHQLEPATPVVLAQPSRSLSALMAGGVLGGLAVYETCASAVAAVVSAEASVAQRVDLHLPPIQLSVIRARHTVGEACDAWGISHISDTARLITSELVRSAIEHTSGDIGVTATVRQRYLHLRVRDSGRPPSAPVGVPAGGDPFSDLGYGLRLVSLAATAWGIMSAPDGKTVWATIRHSGTMA